MVEDRLYHTFPCVRRHKQGRHAHPEAIECVLLLVVVRWRRGRRTDMVIEAAVLIVEDNEKRTLPENVVCPERIVDVRNQLLAAHDIMWWVVVVGSWGVVRGLEEDVPRELLFLTRYVLNGPRHVAVTNALSRRSLLAADQRLRAFG